MQFLIANWYLVLVAIVSGGLLMLPTLKQAAAGGGPNAVPTGEAVRLINREKATLIDVSEAAAYAAGHAIGARNVPLSTLESAPKGLPANKTLPLLVIGGPGVNVNRAAGMLRKAGYADVRTVVGGLNAWRDASLPIEKSA
ncbi:MAG: rhodanese-like domain-containing protein [Aquincola tertiaricarbonis]|uniref:rhodanese-like domain-containing protein n=1 Tax=Aquincola TaxID=391952 RepID=UPI000614E459|nr:MULTISPECIES: rhodanese-like domain-containing protein [Aquincola]MCR5866906.1 rhodanese-like domain-containing protein [Aquincola sp. J276]